MQKTRKRLMMPEEPSQALLRMPPSSRGSASSGDGCSAVAAIFFCWL